MLFAPRDRARLALGKSQKKSVCALFAATLFGSSPVPAEAEVVESIIEITRNGTPDPFAYFELYLTESQHPCPPIQSDCLDDAECQSGVIFPFGLLPAQVAEAIVAGWAICRPGITVRADGNRVILRNDKTITGVNVFTCINMIECPSPYGFGLNVDLPRTQTLPSCSF